jgi:hypothetical protein
MDLLRRERGSSGSNSPGWTPGAPLLKKPKKGTGNVPTNLKIPRKVIYLLKNPRKVPYLILKYHALVYYSLLFESKFNLLF